MKNTKNREFIIDKIKCFLFLKKKNYKVFCFIRDNCFKFIHMPKELFFNK